MIHAFELFLEIVPGSRCHRVRRILIQLLKPKDRSTQVQIGIIRGPVEHRLQAFVCLHILPLDLAISSTCSNALSMNSTSRRCS